MTNFRQPRRYGRKDSIWIASMNPGKAIVVLSCCYMFNSGSAARSRPRPGGFINLNGTAVDHRTLRCLQCSDYWFNSDRLHTYSYKL
jgi:hypothetical protein